MFSIDLWGRVHLPCSGAPDLGVTLFSLSLARKQPAGALHLAPALLRNGDEDTEQSAGMRNLIFALTALAGAIFLAASAAHSF